MNKKGFIFSIFWAPLVIIIYLYLWIFMFGPIMAQMGNDLVTNTGMVGMEALIWRTMNIWAGLIPLIIYIIMVGLYGSVGEG